MNYRSYLEITHTDQGPVGSISSVEKGSAIIVTVQMKVLPMTAPPGTEPVLISLEPTLVGSSLNNLVLEGIIRNANHEAISNNTQYMQKIVGSSNFTLEVPSGTVVNPCSFLFIHNGTTFSLSGGEESMIMYSDVQGGSFQVVDAPVEGGDGDPVDESLPDYNAKMVHDLAPNHSFPSYVQSENRITAYFMMKASRYNTSDPLVPISEIDQIRNSTGNIPVSFTIYRDGLMPEEVIRTYVDKQTSLASATYTMSSRLWQDVKYNIHVDFPMIPLTYDSKPFKLIPNGNETTPLFTGYPHRSRYVEVSPQTNSVQHGENIIWNVKVYQITPTGNVPSSEGTLVYTVIRNGVPSGATPTGSVPLAGTGGIVQISHVANNTESVQAQYSLNIHLDAQTTGGAYSSSGARLSGRPVSIGHTNRSMYKYNLRSDSDEGIGRKGGR